MLFWIVNIEVRIRSLISLSAFEVKYMAVKIITPPITEPITLDEAKQHLRIDGNNDDTLIMSLIKQAREWCEAYQNRRYVTQTLELVMDRFPRTNYIEFTSCSPVQSVGSIKYYDAEGQEHIFSSDNYIVDVDSFVSRIVLKHNCYFPNIPLQKINGVRIRFIAGYNVIPEVIKYAIIIQMKLLYDDYRPDEKTKLEEVRNALLSMNRVIPI